MSNLNMILTADKAEFTNYFKEPVILPQNCEIALVKSSITLPVYRQQILKIPEIALADRGLGFLSTSIDGIIVDHTWQSLYDAWALEIGIDQPNTTVDDFFSGNYQFWLNNPISVQDTGTDILFKTTINETLASMINSAYKFYNVFDLQDWKASSADILNANEQEITGVLGWGTANKIKQYPLKCLQWGIATEYTLAGFDDGDEVVIPTVASDYKLWTPVTTTWTSAGAGTLGTYDNIAIPHSAFIDPNGGYLKFQMTTLIDNHVAIGLRIRTGGGNLTSAQTNVLPTSVDNVTYVSAGILFTQQAAGNVLQYIDGHGHFFNSQGGTQQEVDLPQFEPPGDPYLGFDAADTFYIQVNRVSLLAGPDQFTYRVSIFRSDNVTPNLQINAVKVFETEVTLKSPAIGINPVIMSDGIGNELNDVEYIPLTAQSQQQGDAEDANASIGNIQILPLNSLEVVKQEILEDVQKFYRILNLTNLRVNVSNLTLLNLSGSNISVNNKLRLDWRTNFNLNDRDINSIIGENNLIKIINKDDYTQVPDASSALNNNLVITELPRQLEVRLVDLPIKNTTGSAPASIKPLATDVIEYETGSLDRIVGTIPTDYKQIVDDNFNWVMDYEPYTPVFRAMNNPNPIACTQVQIEVSYRDFSTGRRMRVPFIPGTCSFELFIREGKKPSKIINNLRPY